MPNRTTLIISITLSLLIGVALGFGIHELTTKKSLTPTNSREQTFATATEQARLTTTSPAENMRVTANNAARDYVYSLTTSAMSVAQRGDPKVFASAISGQTSSVVSAFSAAVSKQNQTTMQQLWSGLNTAYWNYAQATAANNPTDITTAAQNLDTATKKLSDFIITVVPSTNPTTLQNGLTQWEKSLESVLETATLSSVTARMTAAQVAAKNLGLTVDVIVAALVKQSPSAF